MLRILSTILLLQAMTCILIKIDGTHEKHCFTKFIRKGDTIFITFIVTGDSVSEQTTAKLFDPTNDLIFSEINSEEADHEYDVENKQGIYKLCFYPEPNKEHYLSLEFYTKYENGHFINMAKDGKLYLIQKICIK